MFQLFSIQSIVILLLFSSFSYSQYNTLPRNFNFYEQKCTSSNKEFSKRILNHDLNYCTEDQNTYLDGCQLVKPPVYEEPSFDGCITTDNKRSSDTLYLGTQPYIFESCFFASSLLGVDMWDSIERRIKDSGNTDQKPPAYYSCQNNTPKKMGKSARPCIDKNYVTAITKAFNEMAECFDLNDEKTKKRLFAKFHVESRFIVNKVEDRPDTGTKPSTNRCFGQLKNKLIETLNQYIYFGDREREKNFKEKKEPYTSKWFKYGDIYQNALTKCSFLSNLLTPDPSTLKGTSLYKPSPTEESTFEKIHKEKADSIICKTSQDPYSCLFYSMYNAKRNLLDISEQLEKLKKNKDFYIDGVPLFKNEDDLKWSFIVWAHNGGNQVINKQFSRFIGNLKDKIKTNPNVCKEQCLCQNNQSAKCKRCLKKCSRYARYRNYLLKDRKSLPTPTLHREFARFVKEQDIKNAEEVSGFMNKIKTQLPALSSQKSINSSLNRLNSNKKNNQGGDREEDHKETKELMESIQKHCPSNINQIFDYN